MNDFTTGAVIDTDGYRRNVAIVLCNSQAQVLWARRSRHDGWQFPQGGVEHNETAEDAVYRELFEEVGLLSRHVRMMGRTRTWFYYDVPADYYHTRDVHFRGQKQMWFLFQMLANDSDICLNTVAKPEFDLWKWVNYWTPVRQIIPFKRKVYRSALTELEPLTLQLVNLSQSEGILLPDGK